MEPALTEPAKPEPANASDDWFDRHFHTLVMGLMLCILATLAVLWFGERRKRIEAETELNQTRMELFATQAILQMAPPPLPGGDDVPPPNEP